jgi:uncharacterized delta-60 repeat protein
VTAVALAAPATSLAAEGDLDQSFGAAGKVITPIGTSTDEANGVAIDSQGRIVAAGRSFSGGTAFHDFSLARYEPNGGLDAGFGTAGGTVISGFGTNADDQGNATAIDSQGRIVVVGVTNSGANDDFAVARFNPNGTPDLGFSGTGRVTLPIGTGDDAANAVAIDSQDRIVAAGSTANASNDDFALVRFQTNGTPDPAFGAGGKVTSPIGPGDDVALAVAIDSQGRIVAAGRSENGSGDSDVAVARYDVNGNPDVTFNGSGTVTAGFNAGAFDRASAVAIDSQGRIVTAGRTFNGTDNDFALTRFTSAGSLDTTFNGTGKVTTPIVNGDDQAQGVAIDHLGKIVAVGLSFVSSADFSLVRYNADGSLDTTFNGSGKVTTSFTAGNDAGRAVAIDQQQRIVVAGDTGSDYALARYIGDQVAPTVTIGGGPPDGSFTNDSTPAFDFSSSETGSTFACGFDSVAATPCTSPFTVGTALSDGAHSVSITAADAAGNPSAAATRSFTVDTRKPGLKIKGRTKIRSRKRKARFNLKLKATEPATFKCKLDRKKAKPCGRNFRPKLRRGTHKLKVIATDRAGNSTSEKKRLKLLRR